MPNGDSPWSVVVAAYWHAVPQQSTWFLVEVHDVQYRAEVVELKRKIAERDCNNLQSAASNGRLILGWTRSYKPAGATAKAARALHDVDVNPARYGTRLST